MTVRGVYNGQVRDREARNNLMALRGEKPEQVGKIASTRPRRGEFFTDVLSPE